MLITRLLGIVKTLPEEIHCNNILRSELFNAVNRVSDCHFTYYKPSRMVHGVCSDLQYRLQVINVQRRVWETYIIALVSISTIPDTLALVRATINASATPATESVLSVIISADD